MAEVVVMPQLGNTVESCLVTSWHVSVGDTVEANTVVADIETDKSAMEVPAGVAGTILALLAEPGEEVPVKTPLLIIGEPWEDVSGLIPPKTDSGSAAPVWVDLSSEPEVPADEVQDEPDGQAESDGQAEPEADVPPEAVTEPEVPAEPPLESAMGGTASPRARRLAEEAGVDISQIVGTGPHGRVMESDVRDFVEGRSADSDVSSDEPAEEETPDVKPHRAMESEESEPESANTDEAEETPVEDITLAVEPVPAEELTLVIEPAPVEEAVPAKEPAPTEEPVPPVPFEPEPLRTRAAENEPLTGFEHGTGIGGRLTRQDIENAEQFVPEPEEQFVPEHASEEDFPGPCTDTPLVGVRKLVSERMLASMAAHAQLTFDASASAESLLALRSKMKNSDPALGMSNVTIGDLVAYAAVRVASKYPSINATCENSVLRCFQNVHLGLAVDTPRGLLVPVIRYASSMGLKDFSDQAKVLAGQARSGNINPTFLTGGTFTVTNLGAFGIESFTPILNSPQTAILGVNTILPKPVIAPDGSVKIERQISFSLTVDHCVVDGADAARFLTSLTAFVSQIEVAILAEGGLNA